MSELNTRGIWTKKDKADQKFARFNTLIQDFASRQNSVFFQWAGEGHELITDELDGENLSGWLIDAENADEFERIWQEDRMRIPDKFTENFCCAEWYEGDDGSLEIDFVFR